MTPHERQPQVVPESLGTEEGQRANRFNRIAMFMSCTRKSRTAGLSIVVSTLAKMGSPRRIGG
jgi:hypothetical protein